MDPIPPRSGPENLYWRVKLGGPPEEEPLSTQGRVRGMENHSGVLSLWMDVAEDHAETLLETGWSDEGYCRNLLAANAEYLANQNDARLRQLNFVDNLETGDESQLLGHVQINWEATNISIDRDPRRIGEKNSPVSYSSHNVDTAEEFLTLGGIADMWLQYAATGNEEVLHSSNWGSTERGNGAVTVYLDGEFARDLLEESSEAVPGGKDPRAQYEILNEDLLMPVVRGHSPEEVEDYAPFKMHDDSWLLESGEVRIGDGVELEPEFDPGELEDREPDHVTYRAEGIDSAPQYMAVAGAAERWLKYAQQIPYDV